MIILTMVLINNQDIKFLGGGHAIPCKVKYDVPDINVSELTGDYVLASDIEYFELEDKVILTNKHGHYELSKMIFDKLMEFTSSMYLDKCCDNVMLLINSFRLIEKSYKGDKRKVTKVKHNLLPEVLNLEINTLCPNYISGRPCKMCYIEDKDRGKELTYEELSMVMDKMKGVRKIKLLGGEPLVHKDIKRILAKCDKCTDDVNICSSLLLPQSLLADAIEGLNKKKFIFVVSLDGIGETFDSVRGKGSYALFVKNFDYLQKEGFVIGIYYTITKLNSKVEDISKAIKFAEEKNSTLLIKKALPSSLGEENNVIMSLDEFKELDEYLKNSSYVVMYITNPYWFSPKIGNIIQDIRKTDTLRFGACYSSIIIRASGDVMACMFYQASDSFGNIRKDDIWNCWRRLLDKRLAPYHICKNCMYHTMCVGTCRFAKLHAKLSSA